MIIELLSLGNFRNFIVKVNRLLFVYDKLENKNGVIIKYEIEYRYILYIVCFENENVVEKIIMFFKINNGD